MFFYLSKIISFFLWPVNIALILILLGLLLFKRRIKLSQRLIVLGWSTLLFFSLPMVSNALMGFLERPFPPLRFTDFPTVDAIVVLGGTTAKLASPRVEAEETGGNRLLPAARLYRSNKANKVLVSGGSNYTSPEGELRSEAEDMAEILVQLGVSQNNILLEPRSRNTAENAQFSYEILRRHKMKKILLVTDAFHCRRAKIHFQKHQLELFMVPVAHQVVSEEPWWWLILPNVSALFQSTRSIKEMVGIAVALLRP